MCGAGGRHAIDLGDRIVLVRTGLGIGLELTFFRLSKNDAIYNLRGSDWNFRSCDFRGRRRATGCQVGTCEGGSGTEQEDSARALIHASSLVGDDGAL